MIKRSMVGALGALAGLGIAGVAAAVEPVHMPSERGPDRRAAEAGPRAIGAAAGLERVADVAVNRLAIQDVLVPAPDLAALRVEDDRDAGQAGVPMRIGSHLEIPGGALTPDNGGQWEQLADGSEVWTVRLDVDGAIGTKVSFSQFLLPEGATVLVRGSGGEAEVFRGAGPNDAGHFWAPAVEGDSVVVQYRAPAGTVDEPVLEIDRVSHLYRLGAAPAALDGRDGVDRVDNPCHVDAMCFHDMGDANFDNYHDAVCLLVYSAGSSTFVCTGTLLNDADTNTHAGWILSANHCIDTQPKLDTATAYFFYESLSCDGAIPSLFSRPSISGGTLVSVSGTNDHCFFRLADDPDFGPGFAAWTNTPVAQSGADVTSIHQPNGEYKRLSSGQTTLSSPTGCASTNAFYFGDWIYIGMTEGGSSGSSLINLNYEVVGALLGSCFFVGQDPACNNIPASWNWMYGRFDWTYNNRVAVQNALTGITPDDQYEDNDALGAAQPLGFGSHELILVDFEDYFEFEAVGGGTLSATATFDSGEVDLELFLLTTGGGTLDSDTTASNPKTVSAEVSAGTYVVRASKAGDWGGDYTLEVSLVPAFDGVCCFGCDPAPTPGNCPDISGAIGAACADADQASCEAAGGTYRAGLSCADATDPCQCRADLNGDGLTDIFDFGELATNFGQGDPSCATRAEGDLNCDGVINTFDFAELAAEFGCDSN